MGASPGPDRSVGRRLARNGVTWPIWNRSGGHSWTPPAKPRKTDSRQPRGPSPSPDGFGPPPPQDGFRLPQIPGSFGPHHRPRPRDSITTARCRPGVSATNAPSRSKKWNPLMIQARSQMIQAQVLEKRLSAQARKKQGDIQRRVNALGRLVTGLETLRRARR